AAASSSAGTGRQSEHRRPHPYRWQAFETPKRSSVQPGRPRKRLGPHPTGNVAESHKTLRQPRTAPPYGQQRPSTASQPEKSANAQTGDPTQADTPTGSPEPGQPDSGDDQPTNRPHPSRTTQPDPVDT